MKKRFIDIENSLNQRFIISQWELESLLNRVFLRASISNVEADAKLRVSVSFQEKMVAHWLLRICGHVKSISELKNALHLPRSPELKAMNHIHSISAASLPNVLWQVILEFLSLQERAKIVHTSKLWHHLTQHSRVMEVIAPVKRIDKLGMTYLLIYNWRKRCRLLLTAQEPTPENVKQLELIASPFYILYREEKSQKEQLYYASNNQFVFLDMSEENFQRFRYILQTDHLENGKPRDLSAYELEIMIAMTGDSPRNMLPTIKCLREKMQTALDASNDLGDMKALRHVKPQGEVLHLLKCTGWAIFLQAIVIILSCSSKPPNDRLSKESCYVLDKILLATLLIMAGLFLLMRTAHRNRCTRSIEKRVEKIIRKFSSSNESVKSFYRLEHDLKEYSIPPTVRKGIYLWKCAESKNTTQKIKIKIDPLENKIQKKRG